MKTILLGILLLTSTSFAQVYKSTNCEVESPCQYLRKGLDYCVGNSTIRINDRNVGNVIYSHFVAGKQIPGDFREIFRIAADLPITFVNAGRGIVGNSKDGDSWINLQVSSDRKSAKGSLTLEQDFEFAISCAL